MRWAARLFRTTVADLRPVRRPRPRLVFQTLEPREVPHTTGTVFLDTNGDGVFDDTEVGVPGVTVSATGAPSVVTGADGTYELETPEAVVRLEFSNLPDGVLAGRVTATSGALVRFLDATPHPTDVNLALNPVLLATSQLNYEVADGPNADTATLVSIPYGSDGTTTPDTLAVTSAVGSTWGLAYQSSSNSLFAAAFLKRHAGMGPGGTGAIYKITPVPDADATEPPVVSLLIDLNATLDIDTGADPRTVDTEFDVDGAAYPLVGKVGLGGITLSADGRTLYAINLNGREIIEIPLTAAGAVDPAGTIRHVATPTANPAGSGIAAGNFAGANMRPFAVTERNGAVFVGVTYTGESNNRSQDLRAFVYAYDPATHTFRNYDRATNTFASGTPAPVLTVDLTYTRPTVDPNPLTEAPGAVAANWGAWSSTFPASAADEGNVLKPQPWLTGLAFDGDSIVLGVRDRFGDQTGYSNRAPDSTDPGDDLFFGIAVGDVLRAGANGAGWQLQAGTGGGEFYTGDSSGDTLPEVATGAVAQVPGFGTVAATGNDPDPDAAADFSGGIYTLNNTTGAAVNRATVYQTAGFDTFGNANGLGGLVAFAATSSIQAGDRVFEDTNGNGLQDPTELGIANVSVGLFLNGTSVGTTTTSASGAFVFENLQPNTAYEIRFDRTQTALANRALATANQGSNDQLDSDAAAGTGNTAVIAFTTGTAGANVHALDAGFAALAAPGNMTLGGTIWRDADNDGVRDTGEPGLPNVVVELLDGAGAPTGDTVISGAAGDYSFANIAAGSYRVRLAASNFLTSGALVGAGSSGVTDANADNNEDDDDNGTVSGTLGTAGGVVASGSITLTAGQEPAGGGNTNTTVDFGVTPVAAATTLTLGNAVFLDADDDGTFDATENGVPNVVLELLDASGVPTGATATTTAAGVYTFTGLAAGSYQVRIAASNFSTGGPLAGFTSSTATTVDPDNNVNGDDNGSVTGTLGQAGGVIISGTIVLALNGEPTDDGDADVNTNLSVDFGVRTAAAAGTLAIGSTVWNDANNNGLLDTGETGIDGVTVELLNAQGQLITTTTTAGGGTYAFTGRAAGDYTVRLAASNFNTGGPLAGYTSSTGTNGSATGGFEGAATPDPDTDTDNDDNGQVTGTLGSGGTIGSAQITLTAGGEPGSSDTNNTLDFGLLRKLSIGNVVFNDADNSGTINGSEAGIPGVTVRLLDATGATQIATMTTNPSGQYLFTNLIPGDYIVELADTNFIGVGPLQGFTSSTGSGGGFEGAGTPDPDTVATDSDDNGTTTGTLGQAGGVIRTAPVTLSIGGEPTGETPNSDPTTTDNNANLTVDFGVRQAATAGTLTLGDRVFVDTNNNGTLDTAETGIGGVVLQLLNVSGTVIRTATTDAAGNYRFANLAAGDYQVQIAASNFLTGGVLVNYTSSTSTSTDPDNNTNSNDDGAAVGTLGQPTGIIRSGFITLALDQEPITDGDTDNDTNLTLDFGVVAPVQKVTVGGTLFNDANNNGTQDSGETGIVGVSLQLLNATGTVVASGTTDASGNYTFANLAPGDYRVRVVTSNFTGTGPLAGFTSSTGTVGSPAGGYESPNTPDPDSNANSDDNGQIGGVLGTNTGVIDTGLITLTVGQEPVNDGDTDNNTNLTLDLGVFKPFTVGDTVFRDLNNNGTKDTNEPGIPGVTVRVLNSAGTATATVTTNAQGVYSIGFLPAGTYTIELAATNFNAGGVLFGYTSSTGTANAFEPAPGTATNNQDHGTITGTLGSGGSIRSGSVVLTNANDTSIDFGVFQTTPGGASLAGRVFRDFNNDGLFNGPDVAFSGVTVTLTGGTLTSPLTLTTDASGNFKFTNLPAGTYTLTETQPTTPANQTGKDLPGSAGGTASAANTISGIVLGANTQATNYRFTEIPKISTGGSVFDDTDGDGVKDAGELGIPGVTVTLTGTSVVTGQAIEPVVVTTDASGNYTFTNLVPGTYTIRETQPTGYFDGKEQNGTPAATVGNDKFTNINLTKSAAASTGFNFGEQKAASIAGLVYEDTNNSGTQDTGEAGIAGVSIKLSGTDNRGKNVNRTATTTTDGTYSFTDLRPGTYTVSETQPVGYADGKETAGTAGGAVQADRFAGIPLQSGVVATAYRFGEMKGPDLQITRTNTARTIGSTGTVTITYTVKNLGTVAAAGSAATLVYGGLTFVSATPTGEYDDATKKWTIGDLAPGATKTLEITLKSPARGTYTTSAAVTTTTSPEVSTTNNSVSLKVFAGTTAPPNPTPNPNPNPNPVPPATPRWFLSSGTNARRR